MGYILKPRKIDDNTILHVINLIIDNCPNNKGEFCKEFDDCGGCLSCWKDYIIKNSNQLKRTYHTIIKDTKHEY